MPKMSVPSIMISNVVSRRYDVHVWRHLDVSAFVSFSRIVFRRIPDGFENVLSRVRKWQ